MKCQHVFLNVRECMRNKNSCLILLSGVAVCVFCYCSRGSEEELPDDTDRLYNETLDLASSYTDSLRVATDSTEATRLFEKFMGLLDSVNNTVAPNTDLLFTEDENDTLCLKILGVKDMYSNQLKKLHKGEAPEDTIIK